MDTYKARICDQLLSDFLESAGAVVIQGAKWCGKTTTAAHFAKSALYVDNPESKLQNLQMGQMNPKNLLVGDIPRLIDEWELIPELWDTARFEIDHREQHQGLFIFTGSAVPNDKNRTKIFHSGAGRFAWLTMRPMSLFESEDSSAEQSLQSLFNGDEPQGTSHLSLEDIAYLTCRGGWPETLRLQSKAALRVAGNYVDAVLHSDISRVDDVKRDSALMARILHSLSRHQGTQVAVSTVNADLAANHQPTKTNETISEYIQVLTKIFVEEDMPAWNPNLRSKAAVRTGDTRYFVDPSIATAVLGLGPKDLMNDLQTFGFLFETLAVRDLRVYAQALDGNVYHYRDNNKLECDAVVHLRHGEYGLVEIKLGGEQWIEKGAQTLRSLASIIDTTRMKAPSFMMVLTAVGQYAYRRTDGVCVVPIGCLRP